jgi:hypothetical protein
LEAVGAPQDLGVREHGLDDLCPVAVELMAVVGNEFVAHLLIGRLAAREARLPGPRCIRAHESSQSSSSQSIDLAEVEETGIGEHDLGRLSNTGGSDLVAGLVDHRLEPVASVPLPLVIKYPFAVAGADEKPAA